VLVKPASTEEVSTTVRFAVECGIPFTVGVKGYSTNSLSSAKSVLIDLSRMRNITVDPARRTVLYGGGCTWADVDNALWEHGLATPSGTTGLTCVTDMISGGGCGMMSGRHGLSIDCLQSVRMVLANGSIVTINEREMADLFCGADSSIANLGIATEFTSRAFPQSTVWGGRLVYPLDSIPDLVAFANEFSTKTDGDQFMVLALGFGPSPSRIPLAIVHVFYNGPTADAKGFFAPLLSIDKGPMFNTTAAMPYPGVNAFRVMACGGKQRWLLDRVDIGLPIDVRIVQRVAKTFFGYTTTHGGMRCSVVNFELGSRRTPLSVPAGAAAFGVRQDRANAVILIDWADKCQDDEIQQFRHQVLEDIQR